MKKIYTLIAVCFTIVVLPSCSKMELQEPEPDPVCETEFKGLALSCRLQREAKLIFTASEDIPKISFEGSLTYFTGNDAVINITGGNLSVEQTTQAASNNRNIKIEGSVSACETITITLTWTATYPGGFITSDWTVRDGAGNELAPALDALMCEGE